jgi:GC-rich sequence DNA-binding factor
MASLCKAFAKAFLVPFQKAIEEIHDLLVPALDPNNPPPPFDPAAVSARRRFLVRRTKLLIGLLSWRKAVGNTVGLDDLVRRLLLDVMLPAAHGGWEVGGQEIMSKVR